MKNKKNNSCQEWLPFDSIIENGIIKMKNNSFVKIIKVIPINFNLKSDLEKEAILNSYKVFLKTCNFDIQILIQSRKENLSKHISQIENNLKNEKNSNILKFAKNYINFIQDLNQEKQSSSKNFYILIKHIPTNIENEKIHEVIIQELNEKVYKIKECISRCGNYIIPINNKKEIEKILFSFFNKRKEVENNF